ncbi:MAG: CDP-diacylglycerol--glycerol-3-phosphate 3-phosphatidyltransferase [Tissierellia bacterium]|nr:CDP-diacylglycerol--glycerol-3-phosphate 3-phosphatidyltransferase [Tissierellia bacterium]
MNLPNKLTIIRILLVPIFVLLMELNIKHHVTVAAVVFLIASLTDMLDGHIARKHNLITTFGKFMDPLADKVLVSAALIMLVGHNLVPAWAVVIIMSREFIITGFRTLAASAGVTIAAGNLGKVKTITQLVSIICLLFSQVLPLFSIGLIVFYISVFFTVLSGVEYIWKNREVLDLSNV